MQANLEFKVVIFVLFFLIGLNVAAAYSDEGLEKARILLNEGRSSAALAYLNSLLDGKTKGAVSSKKMLPRFVETLMLRADAYERLGDFKKNLDDLTIIERLQPGNSSVHEKLAFTYLRFGDLEAALVHAAKAVNLDPSSSVAHSTQALVFESMGKYEKAVEHRSKLLLLHPGDPLEWNYRAKDYECLGKFSEALADRQTAVKLATPAQRISMQLLDPLLDFDNLATQRLKERIKEQLQKELVILPFDNLKGHIITKTRLNDIPLDLMVDTGCDSSMIWKQMLPKHGNLHLDAVEKSAVKGSTLKQGFFQAKTFVLGKLAMSKVSFAVESARSERPCFGGFLGSNILSNFVVKIDYPNRKIILSNSLSKLPRTAVVLPMINFDIQPHCKITLDDKLSVVAVIDTGSACSVAPDSLLAGVLPRNMSYTSHVSGQWIGNFNCAKVRLKKLQLASNSFNSPTFLIFPRASAPEMADSVLLGNDFLSQFKSISLDFPHRLIVFEP